MSKGAAPPVRTFAVIGAGPSGLAAAKESLARNPEVVVFEQRDWIGGTWKHSREPVDRRGVPDSAMYASVTANASRPFLEVSDFPIPDSTPVYPRHLNMAEYLWTGRVLLPDQGKMRQAIETDRVMLNSMYVNRPCHWIEVEWPGYTDLLANDLGVMPKPLRHLDVLPKYLFEPVHAAQYRLDGDGSNALLAAATLRRLRFNRRKECYKKP